MEKFTSLSNIELMYIDGGFNAKGYNKSMANNCHTFMYRRLI